MSHASKPRLRCDVIVRTLTIHTPAPVRPSQLEPTREPREVPDRRLALRVEVIG